MQPKPLGKPAFGVLTGIKVAVISGALAGAVGMWSIFAGKALAKTVDTEANVDGNNNTLDQLAPMPTLVALQMPVVSQVSLPAAVSANPELRSVSALTADPAIVAPVVQSVVVQAPVYSGGGGGGKKSGGKRPVAQTRSS